MKALASAVRSIAALTLLAAALALHAQPLTAEQLGQKLDGVWLVQIGRGVGALQISRVEKTADGFAVEATYSNARVKASLDAATNPLKLEITTAAGTVLRLSESAPSVLTGTFTGRANSGEVTAARFKPRRYALRPPAPCTAWPAGCA